MSEPNIPRVGNKYFRVIHNRSDVEGTEKTCIVDAYRIIDACNIQCPCVQHAAKKILYTGVRNKATYEQDLQEAIESLEQAIQLHRQKQRLEESQST